MNGIQTREQLIAFLLQVVDNNGRTVEELQKQLAEKDKQIADLTAKLPKAE